MIDYILVDRFLISLLLLLFWFHDGDVSIKGCLCVDHLLEPKLENKF